MSPRVSTREKSRPSESRPVRVPRPDDEFALIVEDDLELSPYWFTWLRKAWRKYRDREDIAGITLSVRKGRRDCNDDNVAIMTMLILSCCLLLVRRLLCCNFYLVLLIYCY